LPANKFGGTKISLRSKKADVNALAQQFGAGGHRNAGGVTMPQSLDEAVLLVKKYF
jgi:phosphoesterase RecJ-like protein